MSGTTNWDGFNDCSVGTGFNDWSVGTRCKNEICLRLERE
jgi:hypothetical protein